MRNTTRVQPETGMGEAVASLGGAVAKVVQQHQDIADTNAVMTAQRQLSDWQAGWNDPNNPEGVQKYRGKKALELSDAMLQDFQRTYSKIEAELPSKRARAKLAEFADAERGRIQSRINAYATTEYGQYRQAEHSAFVQTRQNDLVSAIVEQRPDAADLWKSTEEMIRANGMAEGMGDAAVNQGLAAMRSGIHLKVVQSLAAKDPRAAEQYLDDREEVLTAEDRITALRIMRPIMLDTEADDIATAIRKGGALPEIALGYDGQPPNVKPPKLPDAMRKVIESAADKHGVPRHIALALAWQESALDPNAIGPQTKYGKARGLFQFLDATAQSLGIDPMDPRQASDAAMRQLSEQAKKRGWDWAVAHHFAGPDERQHGPKTRDYVRDVREKARRLGGQGQAVVTPAASEAEAIERTRTIADPELRRVVVQRIKDGFAADRDQQAMAEQQAGDAIFAKVAQADPRAPLARLLSPTERAYLAEHPSTNAAIDRWRSLAVSGQIIEDDPALVDQLARLQVDDPAKFRRLNLAEYADRLSGKTLLALSKDQKATDKPEVREQWATEAQILALAFDDMGLRGDDTAAEKGKFRQSFYAAKRAFIQKTKRAPDADETQDIVNRLKLPFVKSGFLGFGGGQRRAYQGVPEGFEVPEEAKAKIVAIYQREGITPTEADIADYYRESAGVIR